MPTPTEMTPALLRCGQITVVASTNYAMRPVIFGRAFNAARAGDQRLGGRRPAILRSTRVVNAVGKDQIRVAGFDMPDLLNDTYVREFVQAAAGSEVATFQTTFTHAAWSLNNWLVIAELFRITQTAASAATTANSATLTGTGTKFTEELWVGDQITVNGEKRTVVAIASDTSLTVDTAYTLTTSTGNIYQHMRVLGTSATYNPNFVVQSAADYSVSDNSGLLVTLATAADLIAGAKLWVVNCSGLTREILATGDHSHEATSVQTAGIMWAEARNGSANTTFATTGLTLEPLFTC